MSAQPFKMGVIVQRGKEVLLEALRLQCVVYVLTCENTDVVAQSNRSNGHGRTVKFIQHSKEHLSPVKWTIYCKGMIDYIHHEHIWSE